MLFQVRKPKMHKMKTFCQKAARLLFNPRFMLCFGIGWMITNGWSYLLFGLGTYFRINWMIAVSSAYMTLLWIPFTPEKLITAAIAIVLLRWLFPNDEKTLGQLRTIHASAKEKWRQFRERKKKA